MIVEKHTEKIKIYNHFTNYKGRLFIKTLCDLFNDVAEVQTEQFQVDVDTLNTQGLTWMLHRLHIQIHKMPHKGEEVWLETWPSGIDRIFALRDYRVMREGGEELIRATSEWITVDLNRRRPVRPLPRVVEISTGHQIEKLQMEPLLNEKEEWGDMSDVRQFTATFDNIDFNGHVTQASYMRWITNSLPFEFLKNHILTEVEIIYEHEIMPDSLIVAYYRMCPGEDQVIVYHRLKDCADGSQHCIAETIWKVHADKK